MTAFNPNPASPAPTALDANAIPDTLAWLQLFAQGKHAPLCEQILHTLNNLGSVSVAPLDPQSQQKLDTFVSTLLFLIADPAFFVPEPLLIAFVAKNHRLSSLVALSSFKTTDSALGIVQSQQNNLVKILMLYSARNTLKFDRAAIFAANPALASTWYIQFAELYHGGLATGYILENLRDHFQFQPPAGSFLPVTNMQNAYFGSTYIDGQCDRPARAAINASIQNAMRVPPNSTPPTLNPRKIAVISAMWYKRHAVYRIQSGLVHALKSRYHLTFFQIGNYLRQDTDFFDEVRTLQTTNGFPDLTLLLKNDFQAIIYPDVGISNESIILANLRLAPLQIALAGHPVSTHGAHIDYFISGAAAERPDTPEQNYSERLVLLPGMGCTHDRPLFEPRGPAAPPPLTVAGRIIINCPWHSQKINHGFLQTIARLHARCNRPVLFRIFVGATSTLFTDLLPLHDQLIATLGRENIDFVTSIPYDQYMALNAKGHLTLDAYHFGGGNTVSDSLYLSIPMLCWQGDHWYNRVGSAMLRRAGLPELVATSESEYLDLAHRLIHDDTWRDSLRQRLAHTNLDEALYTPDDAPHFLNAIDYLIENHARLQADPKRTPLRFPLP